MATFHLTSFDERGQSGVLVPQHGAAGNVSVRVQTGQYDPKIDLGGTTLTVLSIPVACGSAALSTLRGEVGLDRTLTYSGGTATAFFVEIKDAVKVVDSTDLYFATFDFLVCTANTDVQYPSISAVIGAQDYNDRLIECTVSHGIEQVGQATVKISMNGGANITESAAGSISMGVNSTFTAFAGTVVSRTIEHFPTALSVDLRDRLEYVGYPYGGTERNYTAQTLGTVVQNLVEAQGISNANTSIEDSGWTVGVIEPVIFRQGDTFLPWIRTTLNLAGYAIFTKGADSAVYVRPLQYGVTNAATHTLTEGVNILSASRTITRDGIYNGIQVDGLTYEGASVSAFVGTANSSVRTPPGTVTMHVQSNLIESSARGTIVAQELLSQRNFKPESASITLPGTAIEPMDVLVVTHTDLGWSGATVACVRREHRFTASGFTTVVEARRIR